MGRELTRSLAAAEGGNWERIGLNTREWWRIVANVRRVPRTSVLRDLSPDHSRIVDATIFGGAKPKDSHARLLPLDHRRLWV